MPWLPAGKSVPRQSPKPPVTSPEFHRKHSIIEPFAIQLPSSTIFITCRLILYSGRVNTIPKMDDNGKPSEQQRLVATPNETTTESVPEASVSREEKLAQARKFLQDTKVQDTTRERKVEFLQSKGLSSSDIDELLSGEAQDGRLETETQASVCLFVLCARCAPNLPCLVFRTRRRG